MTEIRRHLVDDLSKQLDAQLREVMQRHVRLMQTGGLSPIEGAVVLSTALMTFAAAGLGSAALLTGETGPAREIAYHKFARAMSEVLADTASIVCDQFAAYDPIIDAVTVRAR